MDFRESSSPFGGEPALAGACDWADAFSQACEPLHRAALGLRTLDATSSVLDIGCATGIALFEAARTGARVSGVDQSPLAVAVAAQRLPSATLHVGRLDALPFANRAFDLITRFDAFAPHGEGVKVLTEARRVAKPRATVVATEPDDRTTCPVSACFDQMAEAARVFGRRTDGGWAAASMTSLSRVLEFAGLMPTRVLTFPVTIRFADFATGVRAFLNAPAAVGALAPTYRPLAAKIAAEALRPHRRNDGSYAIDTGLRMIACTA